MRQKKMPKPRSMVALGMILGCKAAILHDRRQPRGGARNEQNEWLEEYEDHRDNAACMVEHE